MGGTRRAGPTPRLGAGSPPAGLGRAPRWWWRPCSWVWWALCATVLDVVVALPARALAAVTGREPVRWRRRGASTWRRSWPGHPLPDRAHGGEAAAIAGWGPSRRRARFRTAAVAVVLLVAVDLAAGAVTARWDGGGRSGDTALLAPAGPPPPPGTVPGYVDDRWRSPAFADSPWAEAYFREFRQQDVEGVPYQGPVYRDRSGDFVNVRDGVRASVDAGRGPVIWFFGGSTVFGEGQRDGHTIPSEVAARSAAAGLPVRVVNFGVQADSNFQSVLRLEQALATRAPAPDLVVFYDGANDITQAVSQPATDQPQLYPGFAGPTSPDAHDGLLDAWARTSVLGQLLRDEGVVEADDLPAPTDQLVAQITSVYERGLLLAASLARSNGAGFRSFFQPAAIYDDLPLSAEVRRQLPAGTVDLSHVLDDHPEVYFDPVHTNEEGARLVASAIFEELEPAIEAASAGEGTGS